MFDVVSLAQARKRQICGLSIVFPARVLTVASSIMVSRSCRVPTRKLQLSAKIPCVILFTVTHVSWSSFELVAASWFSPLLAPLPQQELCDHVAKARHSLSSLLDGPVKDHSSSLRNLEASVVFAPKLLPQNCCRQQGTLCRKPASDSKRLPTNCKS